MYKNVKIAITGAAGQIGYAFLFRLASGEVFGQDTDVHLSLLEIEAALPVLKGTVMELQDCAFPRLKSITATSSLEEAFCGADWAVLIGSIPRKAGMERGDLLKINGKIFVEQGKALDRYAKKTCRILVVGNPCNTNCYIAKAVSRRIPETNFFALMMLDQKRAEAQLAIKAQVDGSLIKNIAVWGNHSATQFPDFYHGVIRGQPLCTVISDIKWLKNDFIDIIQKRGAEIIKVRGQSSAASAANAIIETIKKIINPTETGEYFSVAVSSDGSYGVDEGLVFGFPVHSDGNQWRIATGLEHDSFAQEKIETTKQELLKEKKEVESLFPKVF
jgi:malate dehydrogenase